MLFSAFAPFNMLAFSSKPTHGETIYRSMVAAKVNAFDLTPGGYEEAKVYAQAMGLARARYAIERARNQMYPLKCIELLPHLEADWGLVPNATDGILTRQQNLAARMLLPHGAVRENIVAGLQAILGAAFIELRNVAASEEVSSAPTGPSTHFAPTALPFKLAKLTGPVPVTGSYTVGYANADATAAPIVFAVGDVLTVQPDNSGLREVVTVTAATRSTFTATFGKAHDLGALATTQNFVVWTTNRPELLVVCTAAAAIDPELTRKVHEFMGRVTRGIGTWRIIAPAAPGGTTSGPFTLNVSPLGATPIGTLTL